MGIQSNLKRIKGTTLMGLLIVIMCGIIFGFGTGLNSFLIKSFFSGSSGKTDDYKTKEATISSAPLIGAFLGSMVAGFIADGYGRKITMIIGSFIGIIGNSMCIFANPSIWLLLAAGRTIFGISLGILSSIAPLYMAETSPDDLRGFLGVFFQFSITASICFAGSGSFYKDIYKTWRILLGTLFVFYGGLLAVLIFSPESPRFMVKKDEDKARKIFSDFLPQEKIDDEIVKIKAAKAEPMSFSTVIIIIRQHSRPFFIAISLCVGQQLTGINAIIYFFGYFVNIWFPNDSYTGSWVVVGLLAWNCFTSMMSIPLTRSVGRRTLLLVGQLIMLFALLLGFVAYFFSNNTVTTVLSVAATAIFILGFEISVGPIFWVVVNEIFPEELRGRIGSIVTGIQWLMNFTVTISFPYVIKAFVPVESKPNGYVYLIFAGFGLSAIVFQLFFLPETKGKSFKEIEDIFQLGGTYFPRKKNVAL